MITTKHERDVWVYRLKNVVYAEFNTEAECRAFAIWHGPVESEFKLSCKQELRGLDHVNVVPEGYQDRYSAYIDGLCEGYKSMGSDTVKIPDTFTGPIPGPIRNFVGNPLQGDKLSNEEYIIYLLELILQAIKEK